MTTSPAMYIPQDPGAAVLPVELPSARGRAPLGIAAFLAIPLFFSSLMASTLAQEKPVKIQWQGCHSGLCTVWGDPAASTEARIWLWALLPSVVLVVVGLIAVRLPLGFYVSCVAAIVISMAVVHKTATWARHHTLRYPVGIDLIPPRETFSDHWSRGQWEKDALGTSLSLQHWTIGVALAAMLVMAFLWLRARRHAARRPQPLQPPGVADLPVEGVHAPDITTPGL
ncbi:MAG: hypothetical protein ACJ75G_11640 [Gaiellaceae bacterium]